MSVVTKLNRVQDKAVKAILASLVQSGRALNVMPTGTGKTEVGMRVIKATNKKRKVKTLWLTHTNELVCQSELRINTYLKNLTVGVYNSEKRDLDTDILVASIPTLARQNHLSKFKRDHFDYIFVDEAHHAPAESWERILKYFRKAKRIGMTATPTRPDGLDVTSLFGAAAFSMKFSEAQKMGILAEDESYLILTNSVLKPTITKLGEYSHKELDRLFTSKNRNKIIVQSYLDYGRAGMVRAGIKPKAICYCINVQHAKRMSKLFNSNGVSARYLVGSQVDQDSLSRNEVWKTFKNTHEIEILCAVNVLNEGVDVPDAGCVLMARPTRSNIIYVQQLGRGARGIAKNKFIVLDYVDNIRREWQMYTSGNATAKKTVRSRVVARYLDTTDPVIINTRISNAISGVESWEQGIFRCTFENSIESAKKCATRRDLINNFPGAYKFLSTKHKAILNKMFPLILKPSGYWNNKRRCLALAKKCQSKAEFFKKYSGAFHSCKRNGWFAEATAHISRVDRSTPVICLSNGILFKSIVSANKYFNVPKNQSSISQSITKNIRAFGYTWAHYDPKKHKHLVKKVIK